MSAWTVYWVLTLDSIIGFLIPGAILCIFGGIAGYVLWVVGKTREPQWSWDKKGDGTPSVSYQTDSERIVTWGKILKGYCPVLAVVFMFIAIFLPSTKQAAIIYVLPKIANNEQVQQIPQKLLDVANKQLDEWIGDFKKEKK